MEKKTTFDAADILNFPPIHYMTLWDITYSLTGFSTHSFDMLDHSNYILLLHDIDGLWKNGGNLHEQLC